MNQGELTRVGGIYTASYQHGNERYSADGVTQKEAVLGLWNRLHMKGIESTSLPRDFVLTGELHEEQLHYSEEGKA